jgi:hypothetical protein
MDGGQFGDRGGDSGNILGSTPIPLSAPATALAINPPTGMMPPSPAPLTPSAVLLRAWPRGIAKTQCAG